jgi:nucleoside-diphosphate-sugar epimerase
MLAVHSERAGGQVFVIGDNEVVTWAEYYRRLGQLLEVSADGISSFPLPSNRKSWGRGQFEYLRETPYFKAIALLTPTSLKRKVKALLNEPALKTMPQFPQPNAPAVALDIAALHLTKWRLSTAKARNVLGYQGKISLQEGLQRSVSWLRFAGWI